MADLTPREKEVWAGVRRPGSGTKSEVSSDKEKLSGSLEWSTYQSDVAGLADFSAHETYVQDNAGYTAPEAASLTQKIKNNFTDDDSSGTVWDEYQDYVAGVSSWEEWPNAFSTQQSFDSDLQDDSGSSTAGIRVFDSAGVTYDGVDAAKGAVEVWGTEVHFSQSGSPVDLQTSFSADNLAVSNTTPVVGETVTISADLTNIGVKGSEPVNLLEDGEVVDTKSPTIDEGATETVSFSRSWDSYVEVEVSINGVPSITIQVIAEGL